MLFILKFFWQQKVYLLFVFTLFYAFIPIGFHIGIALHFFLSQSREQSPPSSSGKEEDKNNDSPFNILLVSIAVTLLSVLYFKMKIKDYYLKPIGATGVHLVAHKLGIGFYCFIISLVLLCIFYLITSPTKPQEKQI
ncbi:MAG: hypothetical protein AAF770_03680 [Bacteroidota bacterium]